MNFGLKTGASTGAYIAMFEAVGVSTVLSLNLTNISGGPVDYTVMIVRVSQPSIELTEDKKGLVLTFLIEEGVPYAFSDVTPPPNDMAYRDPTHFDSAYHQQTYGGSNPVMANLRPQRLAC